MTHKSFTVLDLDKEVDVSCLILRMEDPNIVCHEESGRRSRSGSLNNLYVRARRRLSLWDSYPVSLNAKLFGSPLNYVRFHPLCGQRS